MITSLALILAASSATGTEQNEGEKPKLICRYEKDLSSRIVRKKVCLTPEQRRARTEATREMMGDLNKRHRPGN
ncbi:MAG: hypothetical protein U0S50_03055 [Sphingopyxis sp.]|uniref:hypothetical protein n=1 Tax=Sphingopyxis sp. TaxID=1908224 RepID=UPI002ABAC068|nr:hypothetical protein [Sphingopyxis sp.]MDZ3830782.1 hypothetical protein [Sphingopyxis sp.]